MQQDRFTISECKVSHYDCTFLLRNNQNQECPYRDMRCSSRCALFHVEWGRVELQSQDGSIAAQIKVIPVAVQLGCSSVKIGLDHE